MALIHCRRTTCGAISGGSGGGSMRTESAGGVVAAIAAGAAATAAETCMLGSAGAQKSAVRVQPRRQAVLSVRAVAEGTMCGRREKLRRPFNLFYESSFYS